MISAFEPTIEPRGPGSAGVRMPSGRQRHRPSTTGDEGPQWTTHRRPSTVHADERSAAESRSDLYNEPVPFQGRSLGGTPAGDDAKELARSLDVDVPLDDLLPVDPGRDEHDGKSIVVSNPIIDTRDDNDALIERRTAYVRNVAARFDREENLGGGGARARTDSQTRKAANDRWASASRTAPVSFGEHPGRILALVEHEATPSSDRGGEIADSYRGVRPRNTLDRSHVARCIPESRDWKPERGTGFGRATATSDEPSFSWRERILSALSNGESLNLVRMAALASDVEGCRAVGGRLPSSQYRAMVGMISDSAGVCRHARWHVHGSHRKRLVQLVELLDHAAAVV